MAIATTMRNVLRLERRRAPRDEHPWARTVGLVANAMVPVWLVLNLSDALLTRHGLLNGIAVELNPIYRSLDLAVGDVVKALATAFSLVLIWRLRRHSIYTASIALGVLCAWLVFINVWNVCHLI
jgi:hypothetical protein